MRPNSTLLKDTRPDIYEQIDLTLVQNINLAEVKSYSKIVLPFKCLINPDHKWVSKVADRTSNRGKGCPICANKKLHTSNSLAYVAPDLCKEFNFTKNFPLTPETHIAHSNKSIWWTCPQGHEYTTSSKTRITRNSMCRKCFLAGGNRRKNKNPTLDTLPEIVRLLDPTQPDYEKIKKLTTGSGKRVKWACSTATDHRWELAVNSQVKKKVCSFCNKEAPSSTYNLCNKEAPSSTYNLATVFPEIANLWDYSKNNSKPQNYLPRSAEKVWWKCENDHSWQAHIHIITANTNSLCPYCSGAKICKETSLGHLYPDIAKQLATDLTPCDPFDIAPFSKKKLAWRCENGHIFYASPMFRTYTNTRCTTCWRGRKSLPELTLLFELQKFFNEGDIVPESLRIKTGKVAYLPDILIKPLNLVIEYDGYNWHKSEKATQKDLKKISTLESMSYKVLSIRENPLPSLRKSDIKADPDNLFATVVDILIYIEKNYPGSIDSKKARSYKEGNCLLNKHKALQYLQSAVKSSYKIGLAQAFIDHLSPGESFTTKEIYTIINTQRIKEGLDALPKSSFTRAIQYSVKMGILTRTSIGHYTANAKHKLNQK